MIAKKQQKLICKFRDLCSAELNTISDDRVEVICGLYIQVQSSHINRVMHVKPSLADQGAIKKPYKLTRKTQAIFR
jgi:hypothetical protein